MFHKSLLVLALIFAPCLSQALEPKIEVVCSFSILED